MSTKPDQAQEAGELLGKSQRQARRMLQLHTAAPPIKRAVARGLLDPRTALEIVRVHNRFVREDPSPSGAAALKKTERLIERYVSEGWSMRKLERYAAKLEAATSGEEPSNEELEEREEPRPEVKARDTPSRAKPVAAESSMASPGVVVEKKDGRLVVDVGRIERHEISPEERASLIALFEDLLFKTRRS